MSDLKILMVAAEDDALPGAKVGGVADVLRDVPVALNKLQCQVQTVIPSYGFLARLPKLESLGSVSVPFAAGVDDVKILRHQSRAPKREIFIFDHPRFSPQGENVYCHDPDNSPFATDATKFAFFCAAVAQALIDGILEKPDVLHCHDWHAAYLLILLRYAPACVSLSSVRTVFSIHNLAMQGVRPLRDDISAFESWFPSLQVDPREICDPRVPHCINPMRAGIRIADKVHTVSPSYAEEILMPSDESRGIHGGEGLEHDLRQRAESHDLIGILNGCDYPKKIAKTSVPSMTAFYKTLSADILVWASKQRELHTAHWLAEKRAEKWVKKRKPGMLMTSVGRVTSQKASLLVTPVENCPTALDAMLNVLAGKGYCIMLGNGDKRLELALTAVSARHENFIFLCGFSPKLANALYGIGDLFLMPSSFEPCGISQLLAMRAGQPCLVNRVGGLKDTIEPNRTGFAFEGADIHAQAQAMVDEFKEALRVYTHSPDIWQRICDNARKQRFSWDKAAKAYIEQLYF